LFTYTSVSADSKGVRSEHNVRVFGPLEKKNADQVSAKLVQAQRYMKGIIHE